ncbi:hypothetical protein ACFOED_03300 [Vulcaniibacterium thermophilum]|uniref:Uncharacterized protein n=1 Tax=Vulcaniibacterium thermophilum TaxID=1169913 RepID=A0A918Z1Y2_9GAMM|nr:hypothetical protein [Vulcaniibacterium thermophilum]GHE33751.1 hypothetical protein GCM10007167_14690 [Vulcaniibacterium thermophilum]
MKRFRHKRLRARLSILAIVALLWAQLALAAHGGCTMPAHGAASMAASHPAATMGETCGHDETPATVDDPALCLAHCSQGDASSDVARVPAVPALPAMAPVALALVSRLEPQRPLLLRAPVPPSWHRPTAHPAALLLI